ncbi:MAG: DEAD/DEAH box helicase, partial [Promethearchaeota archaeon]
MLGEIPIDSLKTYGYPEFAIRKLKSNGINGLHPLQHHVIEKGILGGKSFLIMAPSSSGKTLIAEISIINSIIKYHKKALYLVPLRA